jgi:hypothetical protein
MFRCPAPPAQGNPAQVLSLCRSIFDIVYQATSSRHQAPERPVNFLYMELFLGFKKFGSQFLTYRPRVSAGHGLHGPFFTLTRRRQVAVEPRLVGIRLQWHTSQGGSIAGPTQFPTGLNFRVSMFDTPGSSTHSRVTPAKAGVHIPEAGGYGPRLSPGRQPRLERPRVSSFSSATRATRPLDMGSIAQICPSRPTSAGILQECRVASPGRLRRPATEGLSE